MALFAPDPAAVLGERRRILREVVLRGGLTPRSEPDRTYAAALDELDREGLAWTEIDGKLRAHVGNAPDDDEAWDILVAARLTLYVLEREGKPVPVRELAEFAAAQRLLPNTFDAGVRWLREAKLCKLQDGQLRDVSGDRGRKEKRSIPIQLRTPRRPATPAPTPPAPVVAPPAPTPAPTPAYAAEVAAPPVAAPVYDSFSEGTMPPPVSAPRVEPKPTPKAPPAPKPTPTPTPTPGGSETETPSPASEFEVLLDVQRRVKRVEDFFSPTVVDPSGLDVLLQSAHRDTLACLKRLCVLLQVYGSQQRHRLTDGRISTKHKVALPEAISLGLRVGVLGLSTTDGRSLTLGDHTVVMPASELEHRAAAQRERDAEKARRSRPFLQELLRV